MNMRKTQSYSPSICKHSKENKIASVNWLLILYTYNSHDVGVDSHKNIFGFILHKVSIFH